LTRFDRGSSAIGHVPVMPEEILRLLKPQEGDSALDCTVGRGGHTLLLARAVGRTGRVFGADLDAENLTFAAERLGGEGLAAEFVHGSFSLAPAWLRQRGEAVDVMLADLGFASSQIDDPQRGLSFAGDGPLDMRYNQAEGRTAAELLANWSERELCETIRKLGEEPLAARIARAIAQRRRRAALTTTGELAELVRSVYGPRARNSRLHPATRTFMALRIAVNDELNALSALLDEIGHAAEAVDAERRSSPGDARTGENREPDRQVDSQSDPLTHPQSDHPSRQEGWNRRTAIPQRHGFRSWLRPGARVGIIAFHSLEDRLVKHAFAGLAGRNLAVRVTRRPVIAEEAEVADNPRARSAKLRVIQLAG